MPLDRIHDITLETLARNGHPESSVRIVVTGGTSPDNITPSGGSRLLIMATPFKPYPESWYRDGIKVITNRDRPLSAPGQNPELHSGDHRPATAAKQVGAVDAIYIDKAGLAQEGTTTNLVRVFRESPYHRGRQCLARHHPSGNS